MSQPDTRRSTIDLRSSSGYVSRRSPQEELLLRQYAIDPSPAVQDRLVQRFIPLARSLAMRYRGGSEPLEDLIQVANLGLVKAVNGFDPQRGKPFTAYAVPTILGELRRHFRDHVWNLRLPRGLQELTMRIDAAADRLTEVLGGSPTPTQIADELDTSVEEVLEGLAAKQARRTLSLDAPIDDETDSPPALRTVGFVELGYDRVEAQLASDEAGLDERERRVLRLSFLDRMPQREIGAIFGLSQMQISRISRGALSKLLNAVRGEQADGTVPIASTHGRRLPAAISAEVVKLYSNLYGRDRSKASTHLYGNVVVCIVEAAGSRGTKHAGDEAPRDVVALRDRAERGLTAAVERLTGGSVTAFLSADRKARGIASELLYFEIKRARTT